MGYIGNEPTTGHFPVQTNLVGAPSGTYTLTNTPANAGAIEVSVQGVLQPTTSYSVSGTTLTMAGVTTGIPIFIRYLGETQSLLYPTLEANAVTTAKIANDAVTGAKLNPALVAGDVIYADGTDTINRLAKGTAAQVLTMNAGATAPEWAAAGGGGAFTRIAGASASNSATVDFLSSFSASYDSYMLIFHNVRPATDGTILHMRVAVGGSAQTGSNYQRAYKGFKDDSSNNESGGTGANMGRLMTGAIGNLATEGTSGRTWFYGVHNTAMPKLVTSKAAQHDSSGNLRFHTGGLQFDGSTSALTGFQLLMSAGNITSGEFDLYGITNS